MSGGEISTLRRVIKVSVGADHAMFLTEKQCSFSSFSLSSSLVPLVLSSPSPPYPPGTRVCWNTLYAQLVASGSSVELWLDDYLRRTYLKEGMSPSESHNYMDVDSESEEAAEKRKTDGDLSVKVR